MIMIDVEQILEKVIRYHPSVNEDRIRKAFLYAEKMYDFSYRISGDPMISHYVSVMDILADLRTDEDALIAGLLHGVTHYDAYDKDEFVDLFGDTVYSLIESLSVLKNINSASLNVDIEDIIRMFVSMAKDLRVIFIKFVDRLDNLTVLSYLPSWKQKLIASETLNIFAPIASRLGMYLIKSKLEDYSFRYLYPKHYDQLCSDMDEYLVSRKATIDDIKDEISNFFSENKIDISVEGRIKNLYSIYRKLKVKSRTTLSDLYDIFAFRIILPDRYYEDGRENIDYLYSILGLIHSKWKPVANRFKDYVALPKPNGYASLHTAVLGLSSNPSQFTEIQIKSRRMHYEAEYGIASHWLYDANKKNLDGRNVKNVDVVDGSKYMEWVSALSDIQKNMKYGSEVLETLNLDIFSDHIFVMTPEGDVRDLPRGSTPVDFAYSLGDEVGHRCVTAKIDGNPVFLDYELSNGDTVEIITGLYDNPKISWLSFVKTSKARNAIKSFFKSLDEVKVFEDGVEFLNAGLKRLGKDILDNDLSLLKEYNGERLSYKNREVLIKKIGDGSVNVNDVLKNVFGEDFIKEWKANLLRKSLNNQKVSVDDLKTGKVYIAGEDDMPYRIAKCCFPKVGMPIVAYINRGNVITVHSQKCKVLRSVDEDRILDASWEKMDNFNVDKKINVKLTIVSKDRVGLIRDIAEVITKLDINILYLSDVGKYVGSIRKKNLIIEVSKNNDIDVVINLLKKIRNVIRVELVDDVKKN